MLLVPCFSRFLRAVAFATVAGLVFPIRAGVDFPSDKELKPGAYFDENLVGKPAGVYEWEGRLFALARVPQDDSFAVSRASAMAAASRELRKWAVSRSDEASPHFPKEPGLAAVLRLHRKYFSGDEAAWLWHSSSSQAFQNDEDEEYVFAICVPEKDILASLPVPGTGDGLPGNWSDYLRSLVTRRYVRSADAGFLLDCAAPDAVLSRESLLVSRSLAEASVTNFLGEVTAFLSSEAKRNPFDGPFATEASFRAIQKRLVEELPSSWIADGIQNRAKAFAALEQTITNAVASAATNVAPVGICSNVVGNVSASLATTNVPPKVLDAERMFLTAGRFACPPISDETTYALARHAYGTKGGGLAGKRTALWAFLVDHPGTADAWNYLGRILREEGSLPSAIACFRCALRLKPDHEFAWANLALAYRDFGKSDLAIATTIIARGLAVDPWTIKETEAILSSPSSPKGGKP